MPNARSAAGSKAFNMWADRDLPAYWQRLGIPGVIDVHVHFMEPSIMAKVWAYFDTAGPLLGRPWPIAYRGSESERLDTLAKMGVKGFSALSYAHRSGVATMMNDWNREFALQHPQSLWSATFFPEPEAAEYVPALIGEGVEVFKAHMQVGDFSADDPLLDPVWNALERSGVPLVLHAGSGPAPGEHTGPVSVRRVLERWPNVRLIIAHLGMPEYSEFMQLAREFSNVFLDTTMTFVDFFEGPAFPEIPIEPLLGLQSKILFGSDFPNIPYNYAHQVEALDRLGLGGDWLRAVLWHNPAQLFPRLAG